MPDPVVVEISRGDVVESVHAVSLAVLGPDGTVVTTAGDVGRPVYGRSSLKPAQAVAVLETPGVVLTDAEVALAAGSHSGEPGHLEAVTTLLARHGLAPEALRCVPDLPLGADAERAYLAAGGQPAPLAMNCSGKHAAMLLTCVVNGWDIATYRDPHHPLQHAIADSFSTAAVIASSPNANKSDAAAETPARRFANRC